ncbi:MAG: hypothetical protein QM664_11710 [Flavihumibacter sp.]
MTGSRITIKIAYRVVLDGSAGLNWEQLVYESSYREYRMQHQTYQKAGRPVQTYKELLAVNPAAQNIPFIIGASIEGYIQQLGGVIPGVADQLNANFLPFVNYKVDVISSDFSDRSKHKIAITFFSPMMVFLAEVNGALVVSLNGGGEKGFETLMFPFKKQLSICYWEESG